MKVLLADRTEEEYLPLLKKADEEKPKLAKSIRHYLKRKEKIIKRMNTGKFLAIFFLIFSLVCKILNLGGNYMCLLFALVFLYLALVIGLMVRQISVDYSLDIKIKEKMYWNKLQEEIK